MNDVVPGKFASVYRHPLFVSVDTDSGYLATALDAQGAHHLLPPDCDDATLGRALADALSHSRFFSVDEVRNGNFFARETRASTYTNWVEHLMRTYGLKRKALFADLDNCYVTARSGIISIEPKRHVKLEAWEGFAPGAIPEITASTDASPGELGAKLREALRYCTKG